MRRIGLIFFLSFFSISVFAKDYGNFYMGCINLEPDYLAAMRWIKAYYDDEPSSTEKLKLDCGKAFRYLLETRTLKLNFDSSKMRCPEATCKLHSLNFLNGFPNIRNLELNGHRIQDLSPLANLTELEALSLEDNIILNVAPLQELTHLKVLNFHDNLVKDVRPLTNLSHLIALDLSRNDVSELPEDFSGLKALKYLGLNFNPISALSPLDSLENLEILELGGTNIRDLSLIGASLTRVQILNISGNDLDNIEALKNSKQLQELNLTMNQVETFSPLSGLEGLKEAELGGNGIQYDDCLNMIQSNPNAKHFCTSILHWNNRF